MRITRRDVAALGALALAPVVLLAPTLTGARVYFLDDLTHLSHPWRVLTAELLQEGRLPLWDPYVYGGIPLAGGMQAGFLDPLGLLFHLLPFARALTPFLLAVLWLGTFFAYLWLRRLGATSGAAAGGALLFAASGTMISQLQFPNVLSVYAWSAGFFLLGGSLPLGALVAGLAFLGGYPPAWVSLLGGGLLLRCAFGERAGGLARAATAAAAGLLVAAAVAVPGMEAARASSRGSTQVTPALQMTFSADPPDLLAVLHPELTRWVERRGSRLEIKRVAWTRDERTSTFTFLAPATREHAFDPGGAKYSHLVSGYYGVLGGAAALAGLLVLARRRPLGAALAAAYVAGVLFISLGSNHPVAYWLWRNAPLLKQLRGPGRMAFYLIAAMPPLVALGLSWAGRGRAARLGAAAWLGLMTAELLATGWNFYPTQPAAYYARGGALVDFLRENLRGLRYFIVSDNDAWPQLGRSSPDPEFAVFRQRTYETYKEKLLVDANVPFHLEQGSGGFEPLVPGGVESAVRAVKDAQKSRALPGMLAWLGSRFVLARTEIPPYLVGHAEALLPGRLLDRGQRLWHVYEVPGDVARARWLPEAEAGKLEGTLAGAGSPAGKAWDYRRPRPDMFEASGVAPEAGRLFLPEPFFPGWRAYLNGSPAKIERALGGFLQVRVGPGPTRAVFVYRPGSWTLGAWLSLVSLALLALLGARLHREMDFNRMAAG